MNYHVILIENFVPKRKWTFIDLVPALNQVHHLLQAYSEVNEVSATIVKSSLPASASEKDILTNSVSLV